MGITERTAADLTDFRRYRSAVEVGDYRIGSVRQIIFVVIVLSQYLASNLQAHLIAGACKHIYPVV
ncbi:unknown [Alistipes sp. CAG:157]|nr:unknown [Alistipes sp. CAG:157]